MMSFDAHANLCQTLIAVAPTPAISGTTLTVKSGAGSLFPATPFNCLITPFVGLPSPATSEIVRVTNITGDVLTIIRAQEGTTAQAITNGMIICNSITAKCLTDIENAIGGSAGGDLSGVYPNPTVVGLQTVPISSTTPSNGQVLTDVGGIWTPQNPNTIIIGGTVQWGISGGIYLIALCPLGYTFITVDNQQEGSIIIPRNCTAMNLRVKNNDSNTCVVSLAIANIATALTISVPGNSSANNTSTTVSLNTDDFVSILIDGRPNHPGQYNTIEWGLELQ